MSPLPVRLIILKLLMVETNSANFHFFVTQRIRIYSSDFSSVENDMFGEFGEFDLVGSGFGGGMEDIEVARDARVDVLDGETTDRTGIQVS